MTDVAGGYRTLSQLGAAMPPRASDPSSQPLFDVPRPTPGPVTFPVHGASWVVPMHPQVAVPIGANDAQAGAVALPDGTWQLPGMPLPVLLPTPDRVVREGVDLLRDWHPRDPYLGATGERRAVVEGRAAGHGESPDDAHEPTSHGGHRSRPGRAEGGDGGDEDVRSGAAKAAMVIGIGGGFAQNAIDVVRLVKKYPEALRAGQFDPALGRMGRLPTAVGLTFLTRPDARIVDPTAPARATLESAGKSFTRFDSLAMKTSVLLGASLAAVQIGSAIPNLTDALSKDGPWYENLAQTTSGRAGVLQLGGGVLGAALFAKALQQTAGQGTGIVGRVLAAGNAPVMAKPFWGRVGLASGALVMANELGYLDMFNAGNRRSTGQVLADAAHRTPVLNDSTFRTGALLAAGGVVGFKAHRAMLAGGGVGGIGKGLWIAGAVVGGLLGTQLLGGLRGLDAPSER